MLRLRLRLDFSEIGVLRAFGRFSEFSELDRALVNTMRMEFSKFSEFNEFSEVSVLRMFSGLSELRVVGRASVNTMRMR